MNKTRIIGVAIILIILFTVGLTQRFGNDEEVYTFKVPSDTPIVWPTEEWPVSTPEEQGMDAKKIDEMFEFIEQNNPKDLHGLLIIRNGHIIAEKYHFPYNKTFPHNTYSVTKSLTGALTGLAIEEGYITMDDLVLDFFPDMKFENMSEEKENMTIDQLIPMTNGIDWPERSQGGVVFDNWESSENLLQYYLDQPIKQEQVGVFNYDTGAVYVLGAIIEEATGMTLAEYGKEKIFDKIGMDSVEFRKTKEGITNGGTYSHMTPRDMARFGYLYLHHGNWDGEQIIPEEWAKASISPQRGKYSGGYGYYFWLHEFNGKRAFFAHGAYEQYITVFPEEQLIVVLTSYDYDYDTLLEEYILPAIK